MSDDKTQDIQEEEEVVSSLAMSDDDLPDYPPGDEPEDAPTDTEQEEKDDESIDDASESSGSTEETGSLNTKESDGDEEAGDPAEDGGSDEDTEEDTEGSEIRSEETGKDGLSGEADKEKDGKEEVKSAPVVNADAQLKQLFAPFKANGRDMQVSSVEDAVTLMKMGANYNKKMQGLKPNLRYLKMLDNNKLLDEEKLNYLIDLSNKNPQAIAKLVKESGIDPHEIDEDGEGYTPNTYTVGDDEINLDLVLDDIKDTPDFQKTIDTVSTKWDSASRQAVQKDPNILVTINSHIASGVYDQVMGIVESEKALNRLTEMSDLQAYYHVGSTLKAQGAFATPPANGMTTPQTKKAKQDPQVKNRKRAAATPKSAAAKLKADFKPLELSDEDFEKASANIRM